MNSIVARETVAVADAGDEHGGDGHVRLSPYLAMAAAVTGGSEKSILHGQIGSPLNTPPVLTDCGRAKDWTQYLHIMNVWGAQKFAIQIISTGTH